MEENRTKLLIPAETKIGTIKAVRNDVIDVYDVLYGGFAKSDKYENGLFMVKEDIHEEVLRKFLESDEGKDYVIPNKSDIQKTFNECQSKDFIAEYKRKKAEAKRLEQEEKERLEREKLEREKAERERLEKERLAQEKAQRERLEQERLAQERAEKERLEKERLAREKAEKERLEKERAEKERLEKERLEKERKEKERLERERIEKERKQKAELEKELANQEALKAEEEAKENELSELLEEKRIKKENILDDNKAQIIDYSELNRKIDEENTRKIVKQVTDEVSRLIHRELQTNFDKKEQARESNVFDKESGNIKVELNANIAKLEKYSKIVKVLSIVLPILCVIGTVASYLFAGLGNTTYVLLSGLVSAIAIYIALAIKSAKLLNKAHIERNLEITALLEKDAVGVER